jgi:hypothetical protein
MALLRNIRTPLVLLATAILGIVALFAIDIANVITNNTPQAVAAFRADLRMILSTAILVSLGWIWAGRVAAAFERSNVRLDRMLSRADTGPLPRIRIVGTAAVEVAPPQDPSLDPKVVELGRRIARKITDN